MESIKKDMAYMNPMTGSVALGEDWAADVLSGVFPESELATLVMGEYIIYDWAHNRLFKEEKFTSFEDAWEFLYGKAEESDLQDFEVVFEEIQGEYMSVFWFWFLVGIAFCVVRVIFEDEQKGEEDEGEDV